MIKKVIFSLCKSFFLLFTQKVYAQFIQDLKTPKAAQDRVLDSILSNLNKSQYGHKIGKIETYEAYKSKVPIIEYDDIEQPIVRMMEGESDVLLPGQVKLFEKTSGSSSKAKFIPYSKDILQDFTCMFQIWVQNLLTKGPQLKTGTFYFSVSPQFSGPKKKGKAQINLEDDRDYLKGFTKLALSPFMAVSPKIKKITDPEVYQDFLLHSLLTSKDLEVLSFWNPSFFSTLLKHLQHSPPKGIPYSQEQIDKAFANEDLTPLFPNVKIISCWGSALAKSDFQLLEKWFPHAYVQKKGLLATEGPITIPFLDREEFFTPLLNIVFLEFIDSETNEIKRLHEIEVNKEYEVILSTRGGLYRYRLGDRIRVINTFYSTPCFDFLGRKNQTSDLVGEKLTESYCEVFFQRQSTESLSFLLPSLANKRYFLITERAGQAETFEKYLCENYHYANARKLGQLHPVKEVLVESLDEKAFQYFESKGMKRGDVKFRRLYPTEWDDQFLNFLSQ